MWPPRKGNWAEYEPELSPAYSGAGTKGRLKGHLVTASFLSFNTHLPETRKSFLTLSKTCLG
jgi:hypothetical protein